MPISRPVRSAPRVEPFEGTHHAQQPLLDHVVALERAAVERRRNVQHQTIVCFDDPLPGGGIAGLRLPHQLHLLVSRHPRRSAAVSRPIARFPRLHSSGARSSGLSAPGDHPRPTSLAVRRSNAGIGYTRRYVTPCAVRNAGYLLEVMS
jgi:hypothetical protein